MKPERIQDALVDLPGWKAELPRQKLVREATFPDLREILRFIAYLEDVLEDGDQIAEIQVRGSWLRLTLGDEPSGEVTPEDLALAARTVELFEFCGASAGREHEIGDVTERPMV